MPAHDAARLARSVLSCPEAVGLVVGDTVEARHDDVHDVACDVHGSPVFSAGEASALLAATRAGADGVVEVTSGLGDPASPERRLVLVLRGRLAQRGTGCACCGDERALVALEPTSVTLVRGASATDVEVAAFRDRRHVLNPGHLQRTAEHANRAHGSELRGAVAATFGVPVQSLLAASLRRVEPTGVDVSWIDSAGAHTGRLDFPRAVTSPQELGAALRAHLHAGIC